MTDATFHNQTKGLEHISESTARDFFDLLKPTVMQLVIFTGFVGIVVAPGTIHPFMAFMALLCIAVGAGASGALNMWYEADLDSAMKRTKARPIPSGRVTREEALTFGVVLSIFSVTTMLFLVNYVAAALLAVTIGFYIFIYTMLLKRRTPQNIVIGGAAGAFAPMIGWAAVTGTVSIESFVLFLIIFMWTPPHFWALALYRVGDYEKVGVPMMPVVAGKQSTRRQILVYSVLMAGVSVLPYTFAFAGVTYLSVAILASAALMYHAIKVWYLGRLAEADKAAGRETKISELRADHAARKMFHYSNLYLFALFVILLVEQGLGFDFVAGLV